MTRPRDRYYIIECWGYGIHPSAGGMSSSEGPACSFSILDRLWGHREVVRDYATRATRRTRERRKAIIEAECARLNADERAWERAGGRSLTCT